MKLTNREKKREIEKSKRQRWSRGGWNWKREEAIPEGRREKGRRFEVRVRVGIGLAACPYSFQKSLLTGNNTILIYTHALAFLSSWTEPNRTGPDSFTRINPVGRWPRVQNMTVWHFASLFLGDVYFMKSFCISIHM